MVILTSKLANKNMSSLQRSVCDMHILNAPQFALDKSVGQMHKYGEKKR